MSSLVRFIKSSGIFFLGTILSKSIAFLLLPLYTAYIPKHGFGYYDLSITYTLLVSSILYFDIWSTVMRFMHGSKDNEERYDVVLSGSVLLLFSTFLLIIIVGFLMFFYNFEYITLIAMFGIVSNVGQFYQFCARGFGKIIDFAISGIFATLLITTSNIIMIAILHWDFSCLYISSILSWSFQIVYLECRIHILPNTWRRTLNTALMKKMIRFTLPLSVGSVSYWVLANYNRIAISQVLTVEDNGIFAVASKFSAIIALITGCFTYAWQDVSFSRDVNDKSNDSFYTKACKAYLWLLCFGSVTFIPMVKFVFPIMVDEKYNEALNVVPLAVISAATLAHSMFIGNIFFAISKTKYIFVTMSIASATNLLICSFLIRHFHLNGANLSILFSLIVDISLKSIILRYTIGLRTDFKQLIAVSIFLAMTVYIFYRFDYLTNALWIVLCLLTATFASRKYILMLGKKLKEKMGHLH